MQNTNILLSLLFATLRRVLGTNSPCMLIIYSVIQQYSILLKTLYHRKKGLHVIGEKNVQQKMGIFHVLRTSETPQILTGARSFSYAARLGNSQLNSHSDEPTSPPSIAPSAKHAPEERERAAEDVAISRDAIRHSSPGATRGTKHLIA